MAAIHLLISVALLLAAVYCVVAWAFWFNPGFGDLFPVRLPMKATDFPGGAQQGTLGSSLLLFVLAYLAWPPPQRAEPHRE